MAEWAERWQVSLVGGDTVSAKAATMVTVTVVGEPLPGGPLLRSGAKPGDILAVTGSLGGSIVGRHLAPEPRLREIRALMDFCRDFGEYPTAAMDISDGFALDLSRLCRESKVGAVVDARAIPIAPDARTLAETSGQSPLEHALGDGEDFELLVTMPPRVWDSFQQSPAAHAYPGRAQFTRVGAITAESGLFLLGDNGESAPLLPRGYEHQW